MIDVKKMRVRIAQLESEWSGGISFGAERSEICAGYLAALDELEALRKPVAPCRFDVAAAREERAEIDRSCSVDSVGACREALALLDKALAAIDAGWSEPAGDVVEQAARIAFYANAAPAQKWEIHEEHHDSYRREARAVLRFAGRLPLVAPVDIEGAAREGWFASGGTADGWADMPSDRANAIIFARAVLAHVGRAPTLITDAPQGSPMGPSPAAGVTITNAHVEEAARRAWCAPMYGGAGGNLDDWHGIDPGVRETRRNEARAVLEYAASIGLAAGPFVTQRDFDRWADMRRAPQAPTDALRSHVAAGGTVTDAMVEEASAFAARSSGSLVRAVLEYAASLAPTVPAVDPRAERLDRCRDRAARYVAERGVPESWDVVDRAQEIEAQAHAMLAAERAPS